MRRLPSLLVNLLLAAVALGAVGWAFLLVRGIGAEGTPAASTRTVTVEQGPVTATVSADGTVAAATTASATFGTSGKVTAVYVTVGQVVSAGQLLARVDPAAAQRALDLAEANLTAANDALDRADDAGGDTTAAADAVTTAELAVDDAEAALDGTKLTAPIAGTVVAVNGTVGASATAGAPSGDASAGFVEIADLGDLQVTADFAEADATRLETGQPATITWSALTGAESSGRVLAIDPAATTNDDVVTYGVTLSIGTLPAGAKPGQTVAVTVTTGTAENVTYVNSAAVTVAGNRYTCTVRNADGTTQTRTVKVGLAGDDTYEITDGLTVGERVVLPESKNAESSGTERQGDFGGGPPGGTGGPR